MRTLPLLLLAACGGADNSGPATDVPPFTAKELAQARTLGPLPEVPASPTNRFADDPEAARFGQRLFFDERLSRDGNRSCATCHLPELAFTDGEALATGHLPLDRHTPTLLGAAYHRWQFWDGRSDSLWAQALVPLESPLEHASSRLHVAHVIAEDPVLRREYEAIFGALPSLEGLPRMARPVPEDDHAHKLAAEHEAEASHSHGEGSKFYHPHQRAWDGLSADQQSEITRVFVHVGKSLEAYQRQLVPRGAPFDRFLEGVEENDPDKLAELGPAARRGLQLFLGKAQCHFCHGGPLFSDLEFHDLGFEGEDSGRGRGIEALKASEFLGTGPWSDAPDDRINLKVTLLPTHRHLGPEFKTPTLRNVAITAPYMHDGRYETLEEVVDFYSGLADQRLDPPTHETILEPLNLSESERKDLVAFLESLTGAPIHPTLARAPE